MFRNEWPYSNELYKIASVKIATQIYLILLYFAVFRILPRFASSSETPQKAESGNSSNAAEDPEKNNQKTEIDEEAKKILQQLAETQVN